MESSVICPENSQCVNINGSFLCKCDAGSTKMSGGLCIGIIRLFLCNLSQGDATFRIYLYVKDLFQPC